MDPELQASGLGSPIVVGLSTVLSSPRGRPPASKTAAPTSCVPSQVYDTRGLDVLTFYDSGANVHLVEGPLAERVGFTVVDNKCISICVVGGGQVWSEYGHVRRPQPGSTHHKI